MSNVVSLCRRLPRLAVALLAALTFATPPVGAQQTAVTAFVGAYVIPIDGDPIDDGVVVIDGSKIVAVGARGDISVPDGATIHDLRGKVLMPGLICTHSHIGEPWAADSSDPIQPDVRTFDAINARDAAIQRAQAGGITTANIMSGSGHLMSGQTTYVKLRDAGSIDELVYRFEDGRPMGGMKMANGTNPQRAKPFPGTRGKSAALVRAAFVRAQNYKRKIDAAGDDASKMPDRDLIQEALLEVLDGTRVVHHHTHRHDDILTVLRLSKEFGFRVVLHHVSDGWMVADEIAAAGASVSVIQIDSPGGKLEAVNLSPKTGAILEKAGVKVAFHTDDPINDSRLFLRSAALAVRDGMSRDGALRAMTLSGAEMLDLGDRIGSITVGKDADLVVLSGDPLSVYSLIEETWIDGERVFELTNADDRIYALGGVGATNARFFTLCCFGNGTGSTTR